ncbi:MAG: FxsA family protein [Gemmatimonadota bacterium]
MLLRLFLVFALLPVAELAVLMQASRTLGLLPTVALVLGTGAAGALLARSQGLRALRRLQEAVARGSFPGREIFDGILILAGGLLLLTPGFITDLLGFAALVPGTRHLIRLGLERAVRRRLGTAEVRIFAGPGAREVS